METTLFRRECNKGRLLLSLHINLLTINSRARVSFYIVLLSRAKINFSRKLKKREARMEQVLNKF